MAFLAKETQAACGNLGKTASLTKLMGARGFFGLDAIRALRTKLPHSQRRLRGLQAASPSPKTESNVNRRASTGKEVQPELQGERESWLPSAVSKMFAEHALLGSEVSQPTLGGRPPLRRMGAGGLSQAREGPGPLPPPRPSSCPRLTSCFSSRLGRGGEGETMPAQDASHLFQGAPHRL